MIWGCEHDRREPALRARRARSAITLATAIFALALVTSTSSAATSSDNRTTGTFLRATYALDRAELANANASNAASAAYVAKLSGECPGVLADAPSAQRLAGTPNATSRQLNQVKQLAALQSETYRELLSSWLAPDHEAFEALARTVRPLHWRNARITRLVREELAHYEKWQESPPDVCADMRAWVSSGYQTLPPSATAALQELTDESEQEGSQPSLETLVASQEGPGLKQLARRRQHVDAEVSARLDQTLASAVGLFRTLGLEEPSTAAAEQSTGDESRPENTIGHGTTAAGTSYTVLATAPIKDCAINLAISEMSNGNRTVVGECVSASPARQTHPSIGCNEGHVTIFVPLPPRVRLVAVELSDGHKIVSKALSIPASDGGPLGVYYQALPHARAKPVSLIELDAGLHKVRALQIGTLPACRVPRNGSSSGSFNVPNSR